MTHTVRLAAKINAWMHSGGPGVPAVFGAELGDATGQTPVLVPIAVSPGRARPSFPSFVSHTGAQQ